MKIEMFIVWDDKAKAYLQPFFMLNQPLAVRTFSNAVNAPGSQMNVNPEDYTLFHTGSFEDASGKFEIKAPELVVSGLQVRKQIAPV